MGFLSKMKKEMKELVEKMAGNTERLVFAHYMVSQSMPRSHPVPPGAHSVCQFTRSFSVNRGGDLLLQRSPGLPAVPGQNPRPRYHDRQCRTLRNWLI